MTLTEVQKMYAQELARHLSAEGWVVRMESCGFWLERDDVVSREFVYLNVKEHFDEVHQVKFHLVRPSAARRFHQVERILESCFGFEDHADAATILAYDHYDGQMDDELPRPLQGCTTRGELERHIELMKTYLDRYLLPFFSKHESLKEVDESIQRIPILDLHKFLGQEVVERRMTIMKLAGNPSYPAYVQMISDYLAGEAKAGNVEAEAGLKRLNSLAACLLDVARTHAGPRGVR